MFSITLVRTVSFSIYQKSKYAYSGWIERVTGRSPMAIINTPGTYPTPSTLVCSAAAGATAGGIITTIACKQPRSICQDFMAVIGLNWVTLVQLGPFELTKLSAQTSVLMARSNVGSMDDALRRSYQQKGTFGTAANIVRHKGVVGLYAGFHLHLCKLTDVASRIGFSSAHRP